MASREPRGSWSMERVVAELRRLSAAGEIVNRAALLDAGHSALVSAAERYCDSFTRAVELAGIAYVPARVAWTPTAVLDELKKLHREGVALNCQALQTAGKSGLVQAARRHFGSWPVAVAEAGLPKLERGHYPTWEAVRDQLQALHARGTKMSTTTLVERGFADLVEAAKQQAGSWNGALEKADIPLVMRYEHWTREDVIAGIRELYVRGLGVGSNIAIANGQRKLVKAAERHFKSWRLACYAAIPDYRPPLARWTVGRVHREIKKRYRDGSSLLSTDVQKDQPTLYDAARRLELLPWREACLGAGIPASALEPRPPPERRQRWTEQTILDEIKAVAAAGRPLIGRTFPPAFVQAVNRRWDSWADAMAAAGLVRQYRRDRADAAAKRLGGNFVRGGRR